MINFKEGLIKLFFSLLWRLIKILYSTAISIAQLFFGLGGIYILIGISFQQEEYDVVNCILCLFCPEVC